MVQMLTPDILLLAIAGLLAVILLLALVLLYKVSQLGKDTEADAGALLSRFDALDKAQDRTERAVREEVAMNRDELGRASRAQRQELIDAFKSLGDSVVQRMTEVSGQQKTQLEAMIAVLGKLSESNEKKLEEVRLTVENKLQSLQADNARQLEQMRQTVDEKLQGTLEKRLGESFKQVSD